MKGFVFSIEAALALLLAMVLAAAIAAPAASETGKGAAMESLSRETGDAAVVGLYLGKDAGDFGLRASIDVENATSEFIACNYSYDLEPDNGFTQASVEEKGFCGEI